MAVAVELQGQGFSAMSQPGTPRSQVTHFIQVAAAPPRREIAHSHKALGTPQATETASPSFAYFQAGAGARTNPPADIELEALLVQRDALDDDQPLGPGSHGQYSTFVDFEQVTNREKAWMWTSVVIVVILCIVAVLISVDVIDWPGDGIGKL
ncbi:hypothetical protein IE53DRAFT_196983 [Violaceomyces palustris]|uniref:Uncharacterized protein n=1 Tax=Violaceomyces palustris TaxID=1673888 RepID=A0ACD0P546_9BASI|nr:hypothetical protein IE53DRAFT_196983 [Violaceomyces palustris]